MNDISFWFSCNINLKLGQILMKNADVGKKSSDFARKKISLETRYHS